MEILKEYELNKKISNFLIQKLKMKSTTIGLSYWMKAISYYVLQKEDDICNLVTMADAYSVISNKYDTCMVNAERAMRFAKEKSQYQKGLNISHTLTNYKFLIMCASEFLR